MSSPEHFSNATYAEIIRQPVAWKQAIEVVERLSGEISSLWERKQYSQIIFTGCGSTYYLSLAASAAFRAITGQYSLGIPAGELVMHPEISYCTDSPILLFAVSRSAATTETITAVQAFQDKKLGDVVVVSNYADGPLAQLADITIAIPEGQEKSIAQTQSFSSMYVACIALANVMAGRKQQLEEMKQLPQLGQNLITNYEKEALKWGANPDLDRFYFLGSGLRYGLACEASLKMKEMSLTHSEPFHFLEFRHGPISMVNGKTLVIGLTSGANQAHELAVLEDVQSLGGHILSLGERGTNISFQSGISDELRNVLFLPVLQLMAYYRAQGKSLNPDKPNNLNAVVRLNW